MSFSVISEALERDFRDHDTQRVVQATGIHLGNGSYGEVVEVKYKRTLFAAKKYRSEVAETLSREHEIFSRIRHPNIATCYGVCVLAPDNVAVLVMEKMRINLSSYLEQESNVSMKQKSQILVGVARGLHHLHTQTPVIIHRDLTATNVLLDSKGCAKISDFGNAVIIGKDVPELLSSAPGTLDYMPPEALGGNEYDEKLDIFSFGHLSIHVLIQHRPHPLLRHIVRVSGMLTDCTEVERRKKYLDDVKAKLDTGDQHPLYSLIISCLHDEPSQRPSCKDILSSSAFKQ